MTELTEAELHLLDKAPLTHARQAMAKAVPLVRRNTLPADLEALDPLSQASSSPPSSPTPATPRAAPIIIRPAGRGRQKQHIGRTQSFPVNRENLKPPSLDKDDKLGASQLDTLLIPVTPPPNVPGLTKLNDPILKNVGAVPITPVTAHRMVLEEKANEPPSSPMTPLPSSPPLGPSGSTPGTPSDIETLKAKYREARKQLKNVSDSQQHQQTDETVSHTQSSERASRSRTRIRTAIPQRPLKEDSQSKPFKKRKKGGYIVKKTAADKQTKERALSFRSRWAGQQVLIKASNGKTRVAEAEWPQRSEYTQSGRLQWIDCDLCHGRVHWTCAGLSPDEPADTWTCPECSYTAEQDLDPLPEITQPAALQRCIRPTCSDRNRLRKGIKMDEGCENRYLVDGFIGRRTVSDESDPKRIFEYLVKWYGWPLSWSSWETEENVRNGLNHWLQSLMEQARAIGLKQSDRLWLLDEAKDIWDDQGKLKVQRGWEPGQPVMEKPEGGYLE